MATFESQNRRIDVYKRQGGIIFADLRDTTGILQLVFDEDTPKDVFAKAESCLLYTSSRTASPKWEAFFLIPQKTRSARRSGRRHGRR